MGNLSGLLEDQSKKIEQIRYSAAIPMQGDYFEKVGAQQLSSWETIQTIAERRMSFARFGDGELGLAADPNRNIRFQRGSMDLARALRGVLNSKNESLLVGMPGVVVDVFWMTSLARYWGVLSSVIPARSLWGDSTCTRASAFKRDGSALVDAWRACWDSRHVTVVTGRGSRFEPIGELFSNVKDISYVEAEPKHAFGDLDRVQETINAQGNDLILIALGPAGTVLASNLADAGMQALDIGHLPNSYVEAFEGGPRPESLPFERKK